MLRVRTAITAGVIGPGLNTLFFPGAGSTDAAAAHTAVAAFWESLAGEMASATTLTIESEVAEMTPATGLITELHDVDQVVVGADGVSDQLPFATQGLIRWRTGVFVNGRQVQGRTYVPAPMETHSTSGLPVSSYISSLNEAAGILTGLLAIWTRPIRNAEGTIITNGFQTPVASASAWNKWAVLRSRRD